MKLTNGIKGIQCVHDPKLASLKRDHVLKHMNSLSEAKGNIAQKAGGKRYLSRASCIPGLQRKAVPDL